MYACTCLSMHNFMKLRGSEVCVKQDNFTQGSCSTPGSTTWWSRPFYCEKTRSNRGFFFKMPPLPTDTKSHSMYKHVVLYYTYIGRIQKLLVHRALINSKLFQSLKSFISTLKIVQCHACFSSYASFPSLICRH